MLLASAGAASHLQSHVVPTMTVTTPHQCPAMTCTMPQHIMQEAGTAAGSTPQTLTACFCAVSSANRSALSWLLKDFVCTRKSRNSPLKAEYSWRCNMPDTQACKRTRHQGWSCRVLAKPAVWCHAHRLRPAEQDWTLRALARGGFRSAEQCGLPTTHKPAARQVHR